MIIQMYLRQLFVMIILLALRMIVIQTVDATLMDVILKLVECVSDALLCTGDFCAPATGVSLVDYMGFLVMIMILLLAHMICGLSTTH